MDGFPAAYCRVVVSAAEGDDGYVVLDTGPAEYRYLYGVAVWRDDDGWRDRSSGNGPATGWTRTDERHGLGTAYTYGNAPDGATQVRAALGSEIREVPVVDGVYLATWWRVPVDAPTPVATAFEIDGAWVAAG